MEINTNIIPEDERLAIMGLPINKTTLPEEIKSKLAVICFDKKVNGAGNVSAVIAIYLFSKYAADPYKGLMETINLKNTDINLSEKVLHSLISLTIFFFDNERSHAKSKNIIINKNIYGNI